MRDSKAVKQMVMHGVMPPMSAAQEAALLFVDAELKANDAKERATKRKDEMIVIALKNKVEEIKVRDDGDVNHTFTITNKTVVHHKQKRTPEREEAA